MVDGSYIVPLSPPCSPRMSAYNSTSADDKWHSPDVRTLENTPPHSDSDMSMLQTDVASRNFDPKRSMIRTHKSFSYLLDNKSHMDSGGNSPSRLHEIEQHGLPTAAAYGGSVPNSPVSRLTPPSTSDALPVEKVEGQDEDIVLDEKDDECDSDSKDEERPSLSAAEIRAAKRKMKRFRLTHNQTRFLMSEFARQAHPDAAHRERLAREIPGLSPRQVQVWFQNRRAKLKRLTSDDRDRMMRSRALPDDFDMASALHSPFGNSHGSGTPLTSPSAYEPGFAGGSMMRPLSIDTLRRGPLDAHMSPSTGISPAFGGFTFTPPQSATETLSPASAHGESSLGFHSAPLDTSPRTSNPFSMPVSAAPPAYAAQHSIPRLTLHADRIARSRAESLQSPLRTSMSYNDHVNGAPDHHDAQRSYSSSIMPYGIGYTYASIPGFQASTSSSSSTSTSTSHRARSFSNSMPRRIELSVPYSPTRGTSTPQTSHFPPPYSSSPLAPPPSTYSMSHMSAPPHASSNSNSHSSSSSSSYPTTSYLRNDAAHAGHPYESVGAVLGEVMDGVGGQTGHGRESSQY